MGVRQRESRRTKSLDKVFGYLHSPSLVTCHGSVCCSGARAWLRALDRSYAFADGSWTPPTWLREQYCWGPSRWPMTWCEIPTMETLDCGALAAVSTELWQLRGEAAYPIQLVLRYPRSVVAGWRAMWMEEAVPSTWLDGDLCYHEATALVRQDRLEIWDPTENRWLEPESADRSSFGALVALRLPPDRALGQLEVHWGGLDVPWGAWRMVNASSQQRSSRTSELRGA